MKRTALPLLSLFLLAVSAIPALAAVTDAAIRSEIGVCGAEPKISRQPLTQTLPKGFSGEMILVQVDSGFCGGQYAGVVAPNGDYYVGGPWFLKDYEGTPAEKLRAFGWQRMHQSFNPVVAASPAANGLLRVTVNHKTDYGEIPIEGWVDPAGTAYFPGDFHKQNDDLAGDRLKKLQPVLALSPTRGPKDAAVSVIEFSDFQCPSCKRSASFMKPILEKFGDRIRYTRVDLPLTSAHPWAFPAAVAGRAIYRQSPEAFWKYKEQIYDSQSELSIFALEDVALNFAKDNDLDVERYQRDVASEELRKEMLQSVGTSFTLRIAGTPTYWVNGTQVDASDDGKPLEEYIAKQLAK